MFISKALDKKNKSTNDEFDGVVHSKISYIALNTCSTTEKPSENTVYKLSITSKILILIILLSVIYLINLKYTHYQQEKAQTLSIVSSPQVNDIYFIDFRLLGEHVKKKLRPTEKYRIAKVVDITGDVVTLLYGAFYYQRQRAAIDSIEYGQLRYEKYFEKKRYDIPHSDILAMHKKKALYLTKRPVRNKLFGNFVSPIESTETSGNFILGKKENSLGEAFLNDKYNELGEERAYKLFRQASELGHPQGQVNLATMYVDGEFVNKDLKKALHWLKAASLQSHKPAILKYGIICKQVSHCDEYAFYKELYNSGVNIKVRELEVESRSIVSVKS
jgi:hypothetical protein